MKKYYAIKHINGNYVTSSGRYGKLDPLNTNLFRSKRNAEMAVRAWFGSRAHRYTVVPVQLLLTT